jgi:hypothetical protein
MGTSEFGHQLQPGPLQPTGSAQGASASPETHRSLMLAQQAADHGDPSAIGDALILKEPKPEPQINVAQVKACRDARATSDAIDFNVGSSGTWVFPVGLNILNIISNQIESSRCNSYRHVVGGILTYHSLHSFSSSNVLILILFDD